LLALAFLAAGCDSKPSDRGAAKPAAGAHADLSGYWNLARQNNRPDAAFLAQLPPNTVFIDDTGATELPLGDYGGLKPTPAALAAARAWQPKDDMTLSKVCSPPSIIYAMQGPFPIEIFQGTEFIIMKLEYYDLVRIIFMKRGHLPPEAPHSKVGDSIGHWEGATLVVDTTHLEAATITNNGLNHSAAVHVIERFRVSADGKQLIAVQEFEDPQALENRGLRYIVWNRVPGEHVYPYECDPTFSENYAR
jgi:hypothetical protein